MLTIKHKKETDKELAHKEVYHNELFLGYFMSNGNPFRANGENWNFTSKSSLPCFHTKTKAELIKNLESLVGGRKATLKQHFGITLTVNA
jgi:hypothetical protein